MNATSYNTIEISKMKTTSKPFVTSRHYVANVGGYDGIQDLVGYNTIEISKMKTTSKPFVTSRHYVANVGGYDGIQDLVDQ
jgi:hypothetical protein